MSRVPDKHIVKWRAAHMARLIHDGLITDWPHEITTQGREWLRRRSGENPPPIDASRTDALHSATSQDIAPNSSR